MPGDPARPGPGDVRHVAPSSGCRAEQPPLAWSGVHRARRRARASGDGPHGRAARAPGRPPAARAPPPRHRHDLLGDHRPRTGSRPGSSAGARRPGSRSAAPSGSAARSAGGPGGSPTPTSTTRSASPAPARWPSPRSPSTRPRGPPRSSCPSIVVGRRDGITWLTVVASGPREARLAVEETVAALGHPTAAPEAPRGVAYSEGSLSVTDWQAAVTEAVRRIDAGELDKVVLARDVVVTTDAPIDSALPPHPPRRALPVVLDLLRRRPARRDSRDAGPPHRRHRHLARAGRDDAPLVRRDQRRLARRGAARLGEGPRGARVRRAVGGTRARGALHRPRRAADPAPAPPGQRAAPRDRRVGRAGRRRPGARPRGVAAPDRRGVRHARPSARSR